MNKVIQIAKKIMDIDESVASRSGGIHQFSLESVIDRSNEQDQWPNSTDNLASFIDHTILKPDAKDVDIKKVCLEAEKYHFRSVCVNPGWADYAKQFLPTVDLCCVVGFPLGATDTAIKASEAKLAIEHGANEIDMVLSIGKLLSGEYNQVYDDIAFVSETCRMHNVLLKVILETCLLNEEQKIIACLLTKKAGADFVKTSTGFSSGGATVEDIRLMREVVGNKMGVKASGGVRTKAQAIAMMQAGANRIGASSSIKIIGGE